MTDRLLVAHTRATAALHRAAERSRDERGDVPGWVLITLMTAALVTGIWAIAGEQLKGMFEEAINGVTGPDDVR
ncbi:hypothetical protein GCM10027055_15080 [Janibacter alkaliphilus]|uniref:Uncharacterized protein n=1 Tax=Janibacter alkaliphilus TaxID=1069963 RepID=A0A852XGG0_9MICO|nr:hypothetical protein [Janibacter alkaliphilus]NYG37501.1 hypothetical protein [Janibacter alkaliphilus]